MRVRGNTKRAGIWAGLGIALVAGLVLIGGARGKADAPEGAGPGSQADGTVATARALVAKLEAQMRSTESSLRQARELLAKLEGGGSSRRPIASRGANLRDGDGSDVEGIWRLVGVGNGKGEEFYEAPYIQYKIMTANHYLWMSFDPETGRVLRSGGGSYTLKDGTYSAHVDYSNSADLRGISGQEYTFRCQIDGDRWYHRGPMPNGAYVDDLWERINVPR
jgi:hypothetical protein